VKNKFHTTENYGGVLPHLKPVHLEIAQSGRTAHEQTVCDGLTAAGPKTPSVYSIQYVEPEKHFVSRRPYGSDLANWLLYELARHDTAVEAMIGQKDAGWIGRFRFRGATYDFFWARYRGGPDWADLLERR
jgi:hypothetical protein